MVLRAIACAALAALGCGLGGCLGGPREVRLAVPTPVQVAFLRDEVETRDAQPLPTALADALRAELTRRNLQPQETLSPEVLQRFKTVRDSDRRLVELSRNGGLVVLVETQARFFSQLGGRYRWNVHVRLTVRDAGRDLEQRDTFSVPALLLFDHQHEDDALLDVRGEIARRLAHVLDDFFAAEVEAASPRTSSVAPALAERADGTTRDAIYLVLVDRYRNGDLRNDGAVNREDPQAWHGGDLAGLTQDLDRLVELGVGTLWLTPIAASQHEPFEGHGAFHGYWTEDLLRLEPRFGTDDELRALVTAAHARGLAVVLDFVVNHVGYRAARRETHPAWFHPHGPITDWKDPVQLLSHQVHGLPDLDQDNPEVVAHLERAAERWLTDFDIDGLRLDAVKHVPLSFWQRFNRARLDAHPSLTLLAEVYDGDPAVIAATLAQGAFTHAFDFPLAFALRDVFCEGASPARLGAVLFDDRGYADPNRLVTFLDNHDLPRVWSACRGERARVVDALTVLLALRGRPALTYGTESGLAGDTEPHNRGDLRLDPDAEHDLRDVIRGGLEARAEHPVLRTGRTRLAAFDDHLLVIAREHDTASAWIAINGSPRARELALPGGTGVDITSGATVTSPVTLAPGRAAVWLLAPHAPPAPAERVVVVKISGATGGDVRLAGSGRELGAWSPAAAPALPTQLTLPVGGMFTYKLVELGGPEPRWEPGADRALFVPPGDTPLELSLVWGAR